MEVSPKRAKFQVFLNKRKQPCFRLKAANGEIILQSESYSSKQQARDTIEVIKKEAATAEVEEL